MNTPRIVCHHRFVCGEGPMWNPVRQEIYWTDSDDQKIYCYSEKTKNWRSLYHHFNASSLALHQDGGLVFGSQKGFYHIRGNKKLVPIAEFYEGSPISNINDIIVDSIGRVYGGQECFRSDQEYTTGYLFRIDIDGTISIIEEGLHLSNGMGFSPNSTLFYLVDTIARNIYVYDFDLDTGNITNKRIFVTLDSIDGLPDGLTVDAEGYVWIARFLGSGITRYNPNGDIDCKIDMPCAQPTSLTFGGLNYNHLYITSASFKWETDLAPIGHDYKSHRGGELYRVELDIQGKPEFLAKTIIKAN
ncbi:MAG: SMP-30/gluconolactonase/LRE family protein [Flavobacteriaceae bacterium]|nr:SMP-30/gluconolactonase/LRE family protein [Flavobacteriaceae bacterium]MCY4266416.1 SMP-30/gluconolactonase/LRE family protein [Flavobacteriaceae bacterium]